MGTALAVFAAVIVGFVTKGGKERKKRRERREREKAARLGECAAVQE
jgi:hypothetical protein